MFTLYDCHKATIIALECLGEDDKGFWIRTDSVKSIKKQITECQKQGLNFYYSRFRTKDYLEAVSIVVKQADEYSAYQKSLRELPKCG